MNNLGSNSRASGTTDHFEDGPIDGVEVRPLVFRRDQRGWLTEVFRSDELAEELHPAMGYVSETQPGITRGPHEHAEQTDCFVFLGPSDFSVYLWDNRPKSATYRRRAVIAAGVSNPLVLLIPPGVVHAYKNLGEGPGWVFNLPNRLFAGPGRREPIDEIRHESDPQSAFQVD